jgi:hypothetical protein
MPELHRRIKKLVAENESVAFIAWTEDGELQPVILKNAGVRRTREGNHIVVGRSVLREVEHDLETGRSGRRKLEDMQFRSFRTDRIVRNTCKPLV